MLWLILLLLLPRVLSSSAVTCDAAVTVNGYYELDRRIVRLDAGDTVQECARLMHTADGPRTHSPTRTPTSGAPTQSPTKRPTSKSPTQSPTYRPTSKSPTQSPTARPTSKSPSQSPTMAPTQLPTLNPTLQPSQSPTAQPSALPTKLPTEVPTTLAPTLTPTKTPTKVPTTFPSLTPTTPTTRVPTATRTYVYAGMVVTSGPTGSTALNANSSIILRTWSPVQSWYSTGFTSAQYTPTLNPAPTNAPAAATMAPTTSLAITNSAFVIPTAGLWQFDWYEQRSNFAEVFIYLCANEASAACSSVPASGALSAVRYLGGMQLVNQASFAHLSVVSRLEAAEVVTPIEYKSTGTPPSGDVAYMRFSATMVGDAVAPYVYTTLTGSFVDVLTPRYASAVWDVNNMRASGITSSNFQASNTQFIPPVSGNWALHCGFTPTGSNKTYAVFLSVDSTVWDDVWRSPNGVGARTVAASQLPAFQTYARPAVSWTGWLDSSSYVRCGVYSAGTLTLTQSIVSASYLGTDISYLTTSTSYTPTNAASPAFWAVVWNASAAHPSSSPTFVFGADGKNQVPSDGVYSITVTFAVVTNTMQMEVCVVINSYANADDQLTNVENSGGARTPMCGWGAAATSGTAGTQYINIRTSVPLTTTDFFYIGTRSSFSLIGPFNATISIARVRSWAPTGAPTKVPTQPTTMSPSFAPSLSPTQPQTYVHLQTGGSSYSALSGNVYGVVYPTSSPTWSPYSRGFSSPSFSPTPVLGRNVTLGYTGVWAVSASHHWTTAVYQAISYLSFNGGNVNSPTASPAFTVAFSSVNAEDTTMPTSSLHSSFVGRFLSTDYLISTVHLATAISAMVQERLTLTYMGEADYFTTSSLALTFISTNFYMVQWNTSPGTNSVRTNGASWTSPQVMFNSGNQFQIDRTGLWCISTTVARDTVGFQAGIRLSANAFTSAAYALHANGGTNRTFVHTGTSTSTINRKDHLSLSWCGKLLLNDLLTVLVFSTVASPNILSTRTSFSAAYLGNSVAHYAMLRCLTTPVTVSTNNTYAVAWDWSLVNSDYAGTFSSATFPASGKILLPTGMWSITASVCGTDPMVGYLPHITFDSQAANDYLLPNTGQGARTVASYGLYHKAECLTLHWVGPIQYGSYFYVGFYSTTTAPVMNTRSTLTIAWVDDASSKAPTMAPTLNPTLQPTLPPTKVPTLQPTLPPTKAPTMAPTKTPTPPTTAVPSSSPTFVGTYRFLELVAPSYTPTGSPGASVLVMSTPSVQSLSRQVPTLCPTPLSPTIGSFRAQSAGAYAVCYTKRWTTAWKSGLSFLGINNLVRDATADAPTAFNVATSAGSYSAPTTSITSDQACYTGRFLANDVINPVLVIESGGSPGSPIQNIAHIAYLGESSSHVLVAGNVYAATSSPTPTLAPASSTTFAPTSTGAKSTYVYQWNVASLNTRSAPSSAPAWAPSFTSTNSRFTFPSTGLWCVSASFGEGNGKTAMACLSLNADHSRSCADPLVSSSGSRPLALSGSSTSAVYFDGIPLTWCGLVTSSDYVSVIAESYVAISQWNKNAYFSATLVRPNAAYFITTRATSAATVSAGAAFALVWDYTTAQSGAAGFSSLNFGADGKVRVPSTGLWAVSVSLCGLTSTGFKPYLAFDTYAAGDWSLTWSATGGRTPVMQMRYNVAACHNMHWTGPITASEYFYVGVAVDSGTPTFDYMRTAITLAWLDPVTSPAPTPAPV